MNNLFARGVAGGLVLIAAAVLMALVAGNLSFRTAEANPHAGQSVNVVICCGEDLDLASDVVNGGFLPTTGPAGELGDFSFSGIEVADVSAANLAAFDTFVLNVASDELDCDISQLSAGQKADIVSFVGAGNKLIMYDSECVPETGFVDYSWLPFPFVTNNPGATGESGLDIVIVEDNTLSHNDAGDPHFINAAELNATTDAVGDMNVMVSLDPNWCVDITGINVNEVPGPVHTYARFGSVGSIGLMTYNGMDVDYMDDVEGTDWLRKIWVQELQQPFNPDNLPCAVPVAGISLTPETATNEIGSDHTVTAHITDLFGDPSPDVAVTFKVTDGPNTLNGDADTTDANGEATFTYTGDGGAGTDTIQACFTPAKPEAPEEIAALQEPQLACDTAAKTWVEPEATATPSPTPTVAAAALPPTGGSPSDAAGLPWLAIAAGVIAITSGGLALAYRTRRTR